MNPFRYEPRSPGPVRKKPDPATSDQTSPGLRSGSELLGESGLRNGSGGRPGPRAGTKLLCLMLASAAISICRPILLPFMAAAAVFLLTRLGQRPAGIIRNARFLLPLATFILAIGSLFPGDGRFFAPEPILPGLVYVGRLFVAFLLARAFFISTSVAELGASVTRAARHLVRTSRPGHATSRIPDPGLYLGLAAGFLPRSFDRYDRVREAAAARGFGATRPRVKAILCLLETVIFSSIKSAVGTASALEARCYSPARTLPASEPGRLDLILVACTLFSFVLAMTV